MQPIVFLDTETTGIHRDRKVWEIAMVHRSASDERELSFFVEVDLSDADPFGLSIGRFYERHPDGQNLSGNARTRSTAWPPREAAKVVAKWTHGAHIVGALANFDTEVLAVLLREHHLIPAWHYHLEDVETLTVGYLAGLRAAGLINTPRPELPWDSDELTQLLGLDPVPDDERHTAMGDVRWAMRIYDAVHSGQGRPAALRERDTA